jgi:hypothetical protein
MAWVGNMVSDSWMNYFATIAKIRTYLIIKKKKPKHKTIK